VVSAVKQKPMLMVWAAAVMVALIAVGLIWWRHRDAHMERRARSRVYVAVGLRVEDAGV